MNGPLKFLTARRILPLLDLLAKFKRVPACSCSPNFCVAHKLAKQIFYFCSCCKKIAVLGMLANARKDHSSPLLGGAPWVRKMVTYRLVKFGDHVTVRMFIFSKLMSNVTVL